MVSVSKHLKGVAVSIDRATKERQFIQTLIILNIHMGHTIKGVLTQSVLLTRGTSWHST